MVVIRIKKSREGIYPRLGLVQCNSRRLLQSSKAYQCSITDLILVTASSYIYIYIYTYICQK